MKAEEIKEYALMGTVIQVKTQNILQLQSQTSYVIENMKPPH